MQDSSTFNEQQLMAEISALRAQFPQTQDLYREVCTLLFFRHGITPTTNRLYQLVRKGSMSAPAEALSTFWQDLREKSRVRIEHPDLPDTLKSAAGELTAALWSQAQAAALASLTALREEAEARVAQAQAAQAAAESQQQAQATQRQAAAEALRAEQQQNRALGEQLAAAAATVAALEARLAQAQQDHDAQQRSLAESRREFALELEKLRHAARLAEERMAAAEKRALLEIDRERGLAQRAQKERDASRVRASAAADKAGAELVALQGQLGDVRQQCGVLEGRLQMLGIEREQLVREVAQLRDSLAGAERLNAELRRASGKPRAPSRKTRVNPPAGVETDKQVIKQ